jgi:ribosome-associated protein
MPTLETDQLLAAAVDACDSKKAEDIRILALDVSESALTDYFLICNGTNDRQNVAISDEIEYRLKHDFGVYPNSVEGRRQGEWVLMDYVDFVVHIFLPETRAHYGLERLKKSATQLTLAQLQTEIKARMANLAKSRTKAPAKKATPVKAVAAKKAAAAKKAPPVKVVVKKAAQKVATKAVAKKAAAKTQAKKAPAKKTAAKK